MTHARRAAGALATLALAAVTAGCAQTNLPSESTSMSSARAGARQGWLSPAAKEAPLIYVSDNSASAIEIYQQGQSNPSPIGQITDGVSAPLGNFVDEHGTLWVANAGNNTVTAYPRGSTTPSVTLSNSISGPITVAVDAKGTVAVGEFAAGTILEFPKGSSSPAVTITLLQRPEGLIFDRAHHLNAAWNEDQGSGLQGRVSRCQPLRAVCRDQGIAEGQSGGLALDRSGNRILGDQTNSVINIFPPKTSTPSRTISTSGHDPYKFALDKAEKTLYVADITTGKVLTYDYSTGTQTGTISTGLESAWGVSLSPAAKPGP